MPVYIQSESPRTLQQPIQQTLAPQRHIQHQQQQAQEPMAMEYSQPNRKDFIISWKKHFHKTAKFWNIKKTTSAITTALTSNAIRATSANAATNGPIPGPGQLRNGSSDWGDWYRSYWPNWSWESRDTARWKANCSTSGKSILNVFLWLSLW